MIYLIQVLRMIKSVNDLQLFKEIFRDISDVLELGYSKTEAIYDLLIQHFGIEMVDERQLSSMAELITTRPESMISAVNLEILKRG